MKGMKVTYREAAVEAMRWLAEKPDTVFIGQTVRCGGSFFASSLEKVPHEKRIELPVMEETQMGMSLGMALAGLVPVSVYPRMDFLVLALNQLVNHADKIGVMSEGRMKPKMIVRTAVGPRAGGPQHSQDHAFALSGMLRTVNVWKLTSPSMVLPTYKIAYEDGGVHLFVEIGDMY